ncbi:Hybrid signal transduction histidine kinase A [Drechslerella dactyloides]|uniref:histidine kinase n=1 Tax=Drechslerella dactyloides TaxID=74499 RepID=A0AAD6NH89_DREDA|nr:Hybrid signal transduction histidine kinase A [Drechslerella dactyloides]
MPGDGSSPEVYILEKRWQPWLIVLSFFVSLLGAYTATQLYVQCLRSMWTLHRVGWVVLAAVEFGGCAIWAFHFVAMIALDIGVPVDFNPPLTIFSAIVAIVGMLGGLTSNIWIKKRRGRDMYLPISNNDSVSEHGATSNGILRLNGIDSAQTPIDTPEHENSTSEIGTALNPAAAPFSWGIHDDGAPLPAGIINHLQRGLDLRVFVVGALMSLSICAMHYVGMKAMQFDGTVQWNHFIIFLSVVIAYIVSVVALIFFPNKSDSSSQIAFATVAAIGINLMHWTGMRAATFYTTRLPPWDQGTSSTVLPLSIAFVAIISCLMSYVVLARTITQSRDRLAEMIVTKRKLWKTIAEKEAAERNERAKTEFISVASHELRTPLHAITGFVDLLALTPLNEEQMGFVKSIQTSCYALDLITKNVLDFTLLENSHSDTTASASETRIKDLTFCLLQICMTKISDIFGVDIILILDRDVPDVFHVDETYFSRVIMNLVGNAMKFTTRGHILVRLWTCADEDSLCVSVSDTGIGISPASQKIVFEPFRQADTGLIRKHFGIGLGLAICRQLVAKMNGRITLKSEKGKGSEFTVVLPGLPSTYQMQPAVQCEIKVAVWLRSKRGSMVVQRALSAHFTVITVDPMHHIDGFKGVERVIADIKCFTPQIISEIVTSEGETRWFILHGDESVGELRNLERVVLMKRPVCVDDLLIEQLAMGRVELSQERRVSIMDNPALEELKSIVATPNPSAQSPASEIPPEVQETGDVILLVEDNLVNQQLGVKMLKKLGRKVDVAGNGKVALEKIVQNRHQYSLVLMDSQMPVLSGPSEQSELEEEIPMVIDEDIFALPSHSQGYQERSQEHEHQDGARDGDHQDEDQRQCQRQHHDESQDKDHRGREELEEEIVSQPAQPSSSMMFSRTKSAPKKRTPRKRGHASNGSRCHPAGHRVTPRLLSTRAGDVTRRVGKNWASNFVKRRPELQTRLSRRYDYERAQCEDPKLISDWFQLIQATKAKYGIADDDIYNFDETGFAMGMISTVTVVTGAETRDKAKLAQPGNREWATVIQGINATGWAVPPFIVLAGQYHLASWYTETKLPKDWVITLSDNGWTTNEIALAWVKHFNKTPEVSDSALEELKALQGVSVRVQDDD